MGAGPFSQPITVQTSRAPPSPPTDVDARPAPGSSSSIEVSWAAPRQGAQQAACISYEVEAQAAGEGRGAAPHRQSCPARGTEAVLAGLKPGQRYAVKVRGVGAEGAGHGDWSEPAQVALPAPSPEEAAAAAAEAKAARAAAAAAAAQPASKAHKRREREAGGQQRSGAAAKTATAKVPPKRVRWLPERMVAWLARWGFKRSWLIMAPYVLAALIVGLLVASFLWSGLAGFFGPATPAARRGARRPS